MNTTDKNRIIADWLSGHGYGNLAWSLQRIGIPHDFTQWDYIVQAVKAWCWYQNTSKGLRGSDRFGYQLFYLDREHPTVRAVIAKDWQSNEMYWACETADIEGVALRDTLVAAIQGGDPQTPGYLSPATPFDTSVGHGSFS